MFNRIGSVPTPAKSFSVKVLTSAVPKAKMRELVAQEHWDVIAGQSVNEGMDLGRILRRAG
jgi:hypothetical protein